MILGISTASLFGRAVTEDSFEILRRLGADTAEVFLNTFSEYEKPFADSLVPRLCGIKAHSVHCLGTQFEPQLFNPNPRVRADAESIFRKVCCAAFILGAKYYTFHGPVRLKNRKYDYDYDKLAEQINRLTDIAQSYGVNSSYENVHWTYASEPEYFSQLLPRCPDLYATLDVKQAVLAGREPLKYIEAMRGRISTVHLCDVCKDGSTALPGKGKIDFEKILREIDREYPNMRLMIEAYSEDFRTLDELRQSYEYIADIMVKIKK